MGKNLQNDIVFLCLRHRASSYLSRLFDDCVLQAGLVVGRATCRFFVARRGRQYPAGEWLLVPVPVPALPDLIHISCCSLWSLVALAAVSL